MPGKCRWGVKFKGAVGADNEYCARHKVSVSVPTALTDNDFRDAYENAFRDACMMWNAIDQSARARIKLPERPTKVQMVPALQSSSASSHTDSEHDSEAPPCPYDEEELFCD